jgi:hypothetical protein
MPGVTPATSAARGALAGAFLRAAAAAPLTTHGMQKRAQVMVKVVSVAVTAGTVLAWIDRISEHV